MCIMRFSLATITLVMSCALTSPANATVVFSDNFNSQNGGVTALNYSGFSNFSTTGNVDLVATPDFGITCAGGSGSCVDLDGSPGPGEIQTLASFSFNPWERVSFSFDVSGSQRGTLEDFNFGVRTAGGPIAFNNVKVSTAAFGNFNFANNVTSSRNFTGLGWASGQPFGNVTLRFDPGTAGSFRAYLGSGSADNIGVLIDNVSIDVAAVPEPATWMMLLAGFGLVGAALRRRGSALTQRQLI
jgi:PEP-CTERM motif